MLDKVSTNEVVVSSPRTLRDGDGAGVDTPAIAADDELHLSQRSAELPKRHMATSFFLAILQAILMVAVLAGAYMIANRMIAGKPEVKKRPPFKSFYTIQTVPAVQQDNQPVFVSYGQTVAARSVELRALVSGEIVGISPQLRGGARVNVGDELVTIDRFNYTGALAEARANYQEALARITENRAQIELENSRLVSTQEQLVIAENDLARAEQLIKRQSGTQQQVEARRLVVSQRRQQLELSKDTIKVQEARLAQLQASMDRLQWRIDQAQRNVDSTILRAPFSGIVMSSTAEIGRAITANDVVVSLYEVDSLEVRFTLSDAQYGRLQTSQQGLLGRSVDVSWSVGGKEIVYPAVIDRVGAEIASNRGGVEVLALMEGVGAGVALRPGAFVEVRVPDVIFKNSFRIPDSAVYDNNTVYRAIDGALQAVHVDVLAFEGESAIVSGPLTNGDEILTTRITEVSNGLAVRKEGEAEPPRSKDKTARKPQTAKATE